MWWDSKDNAGTIDNMPCCPICKSMLFEIDQKVWWKEISTYKAVPDYRKFIVWLRGKCFASFDDAFAQYRLEKPTRGGRKP
jgi:hypothetical protein